MEIGEVKIDWLGHAGFLIQNSKIIYVDPFKISDNLPKADIVLLTHDHYDHCSLDDLKKILKKGSRVLCTPDSQSKIARSQIPLRIQLVEPNQEYDFGTVKISTLPAYNIDKSFHSKEQGLVGYLIKTNDVIIYHAGDTDKIPEMQKLTGYDKNFVALLPIGGRYTMNAEEAVDAVKLIKPSVVVPMHWGSVVGTSEDAEEFKSLCEDKGVKVEVLEKR